MQDATELWLAVPGIEGCEISDRGRVRTGGCVLKPDGYRVRIWRDGSYKRLNVKRALYEAFPDVRDKDLSKPGELWKFIPGLEGLYEVSSRFRVRRTGGQRAAKILKTSRNNGYLVAYLGGNGITGVAARKLYVESAVETLFGIAAKPEGHCEPGEEWRDIPSYEGLYQASNLGRIRSVGRVVRDDCAIHVNIGSRRRYLRPRLRTPNIASGYMKVELAKNGITKTMLVHRLVAATFVPNPLNLPFVHHRDENKTNNRDDNLEWMSPGGNVRDWFDRRRVVISADTIDRILAASAAGKSPAEILATLPRKRKVSKTKS